MIATLGGLKKMSCMFAVRGRNFDNDMCVFTLDKPVQISCSGEDWEKEQCPFWNGKKLME